MCTFLYCYTRAKKIFSKNFARQKSITTVAGVTFCDNALFISAGSAVRCSATLYQSFSFAHTLSAIVSTRHTHTHTNTRVSTTKRYTAYHHSHTRRVRLERSPHIFTGLNSRTFYVCPFEISLVTFLYF